MNETRSSFGRRKCMLLALSVMSLACVSTSAEVTVIGVQYRPDHPFPEYECFWNDGGFPNSCGTSSPMGASAHVFLKNNGTANLILQDVQLSGVGLKKALTLINQGGATQPASVYLANAAGLITAQQLQTLVSAGEPVWYKLVPTTVPPGGTTQVTVRLRRPPIASSINLNVIHSAGSNVVAVTAQTNQPALAGISFSTNLTQVYLYWRRTLPGQAPVQILMDGVDVTANTTTSTDAALNITPSILQLNTPLTNGSFHLFQGVFGDGQTATAGLRAWSTEIIYGMWGAMPGNAGDTSIARAYLQNIAAHLINTEEQSIPSQAVQSYLGTTAGQQMAASLGLGFVIDTPDKWGITNPRLYFIKDEPDSQLDALVTGLPSNEVVGTTGQWCVQQATSSLGASKSTAVLNLLNVDNVYKPYNFYNYGQLADILSVDPYYQVRLRKAYWDAPVRIPLYAKATYIYAMAQAGQASCEPNPLHILLYAVSYIDTTRGLTFPFPTPESKRIEAYYALAAGAKALAYWWFTPYSPSNGLGDGSGGAPALWREIALLGAEVRTAGPLFVNSCPGTLPIQNSPGLWVRSLLVGRDTIVLLVVNDNYYNDDTSCHYTPITNASVTVTLPAWLQSPTAFEVMAGGVRNVATQIAGNQLQVNLGTVNLTRMIVISSNPLLSYTLEQRFEQQLRSNLCALAPELCITNALAILVPPQSQTVKASGSVTFSVTATGTSALTYQWRFNGTNISGATTNAYTRSSVQPNDAGNYSVVVANAGGSETSSNALLTVIPLPSLHFDSVSLPAQNQVRLVLSGEAGGSVTILRSSNLVDWLPLTSLINTNGTVQFTDTSTTNVLQRFYRATSP